MVAANNGQIRTAKAEEARRGARGARPRRGADPEFRYVGRDDVNLARNAGTEVLPGQRKFLDYAFPPTHVALGVVTNTGGRVGWHNSPLPGPFFPQAN